MDATPARQPRRFAQRDWLFPQVKLEITPMFDRGIDAARWLAAARDGSKEALGRMLADCQAYLLLIAGRELDPALRAKGGASDLVQETLLEACRDFDGFQGDSEEKLLAWLRQLLLHNLADLRRRYHETDKRGAARKSALASTGSSADQLLQVSDGDSSPSALAIKREQSEALYCAIDRLPVDYQQVILWRYQEELPFEEIGRLMNRTANAVEKLWLRAIRLLRQELE
jgi:RNA polymerase sigma-70 factor, ECF subfamily